MSKRIWQHPEVPAGESTVAWRSPGQLEDSPEFREWLEREFPRGAAEMNDEEDAENSRRSFLKLMGASTALAGFGMAACRRPVTYLVPYNDAPEWVIPGKATYYASSMPRPHGATPLVVTTHEGRPTLVAPNRLHPDAEGTDAFAQASILDLYSPSRSRRVLRQGRPSSAAAFREALAALVTNPEARIGFVVGSDDSPTRQRLREAIAGQFGDRASFYRYEPLDGPSEKALGDGVRQVADFSKADRILSLDCDFASLDPQGPVGSFFDRRKPEGATYENAADETSLNRLYAVEAAYTLTGGMADHRLRVAPSQVVRVAAQIARGILSDPSLVATVPPLEDPIQLEWVRGVVDDLKANAGRSAVLAGSRQDEALHHIALAINLALGNVSDDGPLRLVRTGNAGLGDLAALKAQVESDAGLDALVLLTPANPVLDAPADFDFPELLSKVGLSIHFGMRTDATAHATTWHVPAAHYLESWSDARSAGGVVTAVQPMILPLYEDCVSELELLLAFLSEEGALVHGEGPEGEASPAHQAVRETIAALSEGSDAAWRDFLRQGFLEGSSYETVSPRLADGAGAAIAELRRYVEPSSDGLEVIFATDASVWDGRWIDNGWLQEAPDPVSKLTWDNAALIAPKTAKELRIYDDIIATENPRALGSPDGEGERRRSPLVRLVVNGRRIDVPVLVSFGQAENTIVLPLGYGQGYDKDNQLGKEPENESHVGQVGVNTGVNAYPLRRSDSLYFATGGTVQEIRRRAYPVALVQEHHAMYGRALAREISTARSDDGKGDFGLQYYNTRYQGMDSHVPPNISLYKPEDRDGKPLINDPLHQWGMSIDLSSCMGCNACLVACQAENNIPIVGKEQVAKGREMHWIRMDRYFASQEYAVDASGNRIKEGKEYKLNPEWVRDNPAFVPQPVGCVQCESAPCETVCPVNATIHTEDGLNAMAYNRCIGTRYCANNCPYKARRFNFFDYNKRNPLIRHNLNRGPLGETKEGEATHLQRNPNVTVRMRGVMEKCTYCVQRLKNAVIRQKRGQKQEALAAGVHSTESEVRTDTLRIPVDSVKTACQDACPANAITFGNLLDEQQSALGRSKAIRRNYDLLHYINTRPRTSYLARVKNPNPDMPDAPYVGKATIHMV